MYDDITNSGNTEILFTFIVYKNYFPNYSSNLEERRNQIIAMSNDERQKESTPLLESA